MKIIKRIAVIWYIIEGLLLCFGPLYIFKPCPVHEDTVMKCIMSCKAEIAIGIVGITAGILLIFAKEFYSIIFSTISG